jgi:5'-nucleotidase
VRIEERGPDRFAVHGTPADCARLGLLRLVPDAKWVLSGINNGGNLGADVHYSGTVAAVREAVLHGWSGIALSQYLRRGVAVDWNRAAQMATRVLADLMQRPVETGAFFNVNLPHLDPGESEPDIVFCPLDSNPLPLSYRHDEGEGMFYDGDYQARKRTKGSDVDLCFNGQISVSVVRLF